MAVWKKVIVGYEVKIHNVDHLPPHCHVYIDGHNAQIDLWTLDVLHPPPHRIPPNLRRGLKAEQEAMLGAWEDVVLIPPGSSPGSL